MEVENNSYLQPENITVKLDLEIFSNWRQARDITDRNKERKRHGGLLRDSRALCDFLKALVATPHGRANLKTVKIKLVSFREEQWRSVEYRREFDAIVVTLDAVFGVTGMATVRRTRRQLAFPRIAKSTRGCLWENVHQGRYDPVLHPGQM